MVKEISFDNITPKSTGCGIGIRVRTIPLSPRGEELAKERTLTVLEDARGKKGKRRSKESK